MEPIVPFEPVAAEDIPTGPRWVAQIKWDGVRMLVYFDGASTRLVNRRLHERTMQYPELADARRYLRAKSAILDGEIVAFDGGKPSFHEVMRRDGIRSARAVSAAVREIPVAYMVFDILYLDGEWVTGHSLEERQRLLGRTLEPCDNVRLVENAADGARLFEVMRAHGMEGIVVKDLASTYAIGGKDGRWRKIKVRRDLTAVVGGVTYDGGLVNALLLGLYDRQGRLHYIGHAGSGRLTVRDRAGIAAAAELIRSPDCPFAAKPPRSAGAVWLRPLLTAKVRYLEWTPGRTLRHPVIEAVGTGQAEACTFDRIDDAADPAAD
ncbi:MAG: DNA ligase [Thermobacillus sp. ZCTH02-B1]|uniref:ATP-dependent DNA ligase n=1 Tax=Thermobacillus sp. ZCTH02-B1 TaxID=1858795 RepID=UPI000B55B415|nr:RNA ligase family protein [Thermobacillus sp. ZCTH02-B1]OUM94846.1 MAG: DNA ligase [Thermobacillus sp. ZCTH02-B1]